MGPFLPLFQVSVEHDFYSDRQLPGVSFVPILDTQAVIRNAGLLIRKTRSGVEVYYDRSRSPSLELMLADSNGGLALLFKVYADSEFRNYSEGFLCQTGAIPYFESQRGIADGERIRLHRGACVSRDDLESTASSALVGLLGAREPAAGPVCAAKLMIRPELGVNLESEKNTAPLHYFARFGARETYWVYYLLGPFAEKRASIVDLDGHVDFEPIGPVSLGDGRPAFAFRSTAAIALRQLSACRFQLREASAGNCKVLIRRLPVASAGQIGRQRSGTKAITVSEVYVNG